MSSELNNQNMKNLKFIALAIGMILFGQQAKATEPDVLSVQSHGLSATTVPSSDHVVPVKVSVEVIFGKKRANCEDKGFCRIIIVVSVDPQALLPTMLYDPNTGGIEIEVSKQYLLETQPEKLKYFTGQTEFELEEDFVVSMEVSNKLGSSTPLVLPAGKHRLINKGDSFKILFGE